MFDNYQNWKMRARSLLGLHFVTNSPLSAGFQFEKVAIGISPPDDTVTAP